MITDLVKVQIISNTYHKKLYLTKLVQLEVLCLKQSEPSYFAFSCIDLLTVTENQMILTIRCIGKSACRMQKRSKKLCGKQSKKEKKTEKGKKKGIAGLFDNPRNQFTRSCRNLSAVMK